MSEGSNTMLDSTDIERAKVATKLCDDIWKRPEYEGKKFDYGKCVKDSAIAQKVNYPGGSRRKSRKNKRVKKTKKCKGGRRHRKSQRRSRR